VEFAETQRGALQLENLGYKTINFATGFAWNEFEMPICPRTSAVFLRDIGV